MLWVLRGREEWVGWGGVGWIFGLGEGEDQAWLKRRTDGCYKVAMESEGHNATCAKDRNLFPRLQYMVAAAYEVVYAAWSWV